MVCRRSSYDTKCYEPTECVFDPRGNVVQLIVSPASITPEQKATCNALAKQVVDAMDYIGILAVKCSSRRALVEIMVNQATAPARAQLGPPHDRAVRDVPVRAVAAGRAGSAAR